MSQRVSRFKHLNQSVRRWYKRRYIVTEGRLNATQKHREPERTLHKLHRAKVMDKSLLCTEFCDQTDCPHMAVNVCGHVTLLYLTAGISAHGMSVKLASSLWICAASTIGHRKEVFFGIGNEELPYYRSPTKFAKVMFLPLSVSHSVHRGVCSRGCLVLGGGWSRGVCAWWKPPGRLLLRAVRILLECILVAL